MAKETSLVPQEYLTHEMAVEIAQSADLLEALGRLVHTTSYMELKRGSATQQALDIATKGARFKALVNTIQHWSVNPDLFYEVGKGVTTQRVALAKQDPPPENVTGIITSANHETATWGVIDLRMSRVQEIVEGAMDVIRDSHMVEPGEMQKLLGISVQSSQIARMRARRTENPEQNPGAAR